jgi:glycosyltransferase involved in cell wall biosynthesis
MGGCELWRTLLPVTELQRQGYPLVEWGMRDDPRLAHIAHLFDAIVLQRLSWPKEAQEQEYQFFRALHRANLAVIYEADDDIFTDSFVKRNMENWGFSEEQSTAQRDGNVRSLQRCDGVTVSTQRVATIVRNYTDKPVKVVGNYMDLSWWKKIQKRARRDPKLTGITIGWAGGRRPDSDIEPMVKAWGRLAVKYPKVTFVVQGHSSDIFTDNVPIERMAFTKWMEIDNYPAGLVNIDIGCCPLDNSQFNRGKSFIKAMEYAASNAPVVASPMVYDGLIEHGVDGYIADTVDDWECYLSKLVDDYTLRHDMSKRLLAKVRKYYSLETQAWRWMEAWGDIVKNFKESYRQPHILLPEGVDYYARA